MDIDIGLAAVVGMAAVATGVVGCPQTLTFLVLETTNDLAIASAVMVASAISSVLVREAFGFSFSTWRRHLRGESIKAPMTWGAYTLAMVSARLADTFAKYGVELDESDHLPEDFTGAELAVVTAHGSLGDSSQFQRVRDDGDLLVSATNLASKLRNVRVAVLFVCSAGRTDKVPGAATTFGLAKKVLEKGSSAVIASPWPLDSRVTYHWLPTFLDAWTNGKRLDEAVFAANQAVSEGLRSALRSEAPALSL